MTVADTLRLLIAAEIPTDLETIQQSMLEIGTRLHTEPISDELYAAAHHRLDQLLTARAHVLNDQALDRCRKLHDLPTWRVIPCHDCTETVHATPRGVR